MLSDLLLVTEADENYTEEFFAHIPDYACGVCPECGGYLELFELDLICDTCEYRKECC